VSGVFCVLFVMAGIGANLDGTKQQPAQPALGAVFFAIAAVCAWFTWYGLAVPARDSELAKAQARIRRRTESRKLLETNSMLAAELHIGRPDLHRTYDDGGLVDVNGAPVATLASLPGVDAPLAQRIVDARESVGRFDSTDDLEALLNLSAHDLDGCRDLLAYSRSSDDDSRRRTRRS
jgi:hypothetical protein